MTITVRILKDQKLNATESLVLLAINKHGEIQECIAVAYHPDSSPVTFRSAEVVNTIDQNIVWIRRGMMNGRNADVLVNPRREVHLDPRLVKLDKTTPSPMMMSK